MKQVWMLNHHAQIPGGPGGTRHFHLAEHLKTFGWDASIIAASTEGKTGRQRLASGEKSRLERFGDVPYLWVRTPAYQGNGLDRILNMVTYTWRVLLPGTTKVLSSPDVIIGSSVHPLAAWAGMRLARRHKVPFIFEVRDLWPQTLVDMGRLKEKSIMTWALRRLELLLYKRASRIVMLLPQAWEYTSALGIPKEKVVWIPNGVDLSLYPPVTQQAYAPVGKRAFTLMYFGAHGQANDLENILLAMKRVQKLPGGQAIRLRLIGNGPRKPKLQAMAKEWGLSNVIFEDVIPKEQIPGVARQADAFVISIGDLPDLYRYGISPNKLFDYFAAGKPIIIASSLIRNPVEDANAGYVVAAGNPVLLADAITKMAFVGLDARLRMGRAGREYVEKHYDYKNLSRMLAQTLDSVTNG